MRLLNTKTGRFVDVEDPRTVRYAILSHVWTKKKDHGSSEQTHQQILQISNNSPGENSSILPHLSAKIQGFCRVADQDDFELGWVDSCCIDQTSSTELSEAINSMYKWYSHSGVCYVFLPDVSKSADWEKEFRRSVWFERGWTLQELLAPGMVVFLAKTGQYLGSKRTLASLITEVTGIPREVLTGEKRLSDISVAQRLRWAAKRRTTRLEDRAYSLMGIFGVHMPITYGEGTYAFVRLQEEILKSFRDTSFLLWGHVLPSENVSLGNPLAATSSALAKSGKAQRFSEEDPLSTPEECLLALSPDPFKDIPTLRAISPESFAGKLGPEIEVEAVTHPTYTVTPYGIRTQSPLAMIRKFATLRTPPDVQLFAMPLPYTDGNGGLAALLLRRRSNAKAKHEYAVGAYLFQGSSHSSPTYYRFTFLRRSLDPMTNLLDSTRLVDLYIPHRPSKLDGDVKKLGILGRTSGSTIRLTNRCRKLLESQGFKVTEGAGMIDIPDEIQDVKYPNSVDGRGTSPAASFTITHPAKISIARKDVTIRIAVGRCICKYAWEPGVLALLVSTASSFPVLNRKDHKRDNAVHVDSWPTSYGTATQRTSFRASGVKHFLTLTISRAPSRGPSPSRPSQTHYLLDVEIEQART